MLFSSGDPQTQILKFRYGHCHFSHDFSGIWVGAIYFSYAKGEQIYSYCDKHQIHKMVTAREHT